MREWLTDGGWYVEKAGATGRPVGRPRKAKRQQKAARRLFMGHHRLDAIAEFTGLKKDTIERRLKEERDLRKRIQKGLATQLLACGYPVEETARRTGLSKRTVWNLKKNPPPPCEFSLSDFYPEHLDAYAEVLRQYVVEDQELGEQERATLHWLASAVYVAHWATEGAIYGFNSPNGKESDLLTSQLAARFDSQDRALHRIENTLAALLDRTDSTPDAFAARFPELEDDVAAVRETLSQLDEDSSTRTDIEKDRGAPWTGRPTSRRGDLLLSSPGLHQEAIDGQPYHDTQPAGGAGQPLRALPRPRGNDSSPARDERRHPRLA
jgi:hypothetical protein